MELDHEFTVPVPVDQAWSALLDVERVALCMPGATLDSIDGTDYRGRLKVRLGAMTITYRGTAKIVEADADARTLTIEASGKEARGSGTAAATIRARMSETDGTTRVTVHTELNVTGRPAQFGRNILAEVGARLVGRFAKALAAELAENPVSKETAPESTGKAATAAEPPRADAGSSSAEPGTTASAGTGSATEPAGGPAEPETTATAEPAGTAPATSSPPEPAQAAPADAESRPVPEATESAPVASTDAETTAAPDAASSTAEPAPTTSADTEATAAPETTAPDAASGTTEPTPTAPTNAETTPSSESTTSGTASSTTEPTPTAPADAETTAAPDAASGTAEPAEAGRATVASGAASGAAESAQATPDGTGSAAAGSSGGRETGEAAAADSAKGVREAAVTETSGAIAPKTTARRGGAHRRRPPEDDAIDLLEVAGPSVAKRAAPLVGALAALLTVRYLFRRRRGRHHR